MIDATDDYGSTPLHYATENRGPSALEALIRLGANPFVKNTDGELPLDIARRHYSQAEYIRMLEKYMMELEAEKVEP